MATTLLLFECDVLRPRWGWLLFLGIFMIILGTVALFMMPAATLGTDIGVGLAARGQRHHRDDPCLSSAKVGWPVSAPDRWSSRSTDWPARGHASCGRRNGMDAALRFVFYRHWPVPADCDDQLEISKLGLGCFRRDCYAWARDSALDRVAMVRCVVPGFGGWGLIDPARLVLCYVRTRDP